MSLDQPVRSLEVIEHALAVLQEAEFGKNLRTLSYYQDSTWAALAYLHRRMNEEVNFKSVTHGLQDVHSFERTFVIRSNLNTMGASPIALRISTWDNLFSMSEIADSCRGYVALEWTVSPYSLGDEKKRVFPGQYRLFLSNRLVRLESSAIMSPIAYRRFEVLEWAAGSTTALVTHWGYDPGGVYVEAIGKRSVPISYEQNLVWLPDEAPTKAEGNNVLSFSKAPKPSIKVAKHTRAGLACAIDGLSVYIGKSGVPDDPTSDVEFKGFARDCDLTAFEKAKTCTPSYLKIYNLEQIQDKLQFTTVYEREEVLPMLLSLCDKAVQIDPQCSSASS